MPAEGADERPETSLTPAQEERVRRLLAEARHDQPMPADVAERMDTALAELAASGDEREAPARQPSAAVIELAHSAAARRRRRRVTQLLVAAAAVTVVGVGGPQLLGGLAGSGSMDSGGDSAVSADRGATEFEEGSGGGDGDAGESARTIAPETARLPKARPQLRAQDFQRQVAELREAGAAAYAAGAPTESPTPSDSADAQALDSVRRLSRCQAGADWPAGRRVEVLYDGDRGVLVFRQPRSGQQEVDLFLCGQDTPTRITVLPAP